MRRLGRIAAVGAAAIALAGCQRGPTWLRVERVDPSSERTEVPIAVNQDLVVHFSEAVDPFTVTKESFRVRDSEGHAVDGRIEVGTRSVRFRPVPPVTPSLSDGSFRPGRSYWLEVPGMPTSFAIRARAGTTLEHGFSRVFRVPEDPGELGLPTPFLPVDAGAQPLRLELSPMGGLRMAADSRTLTLQFSTPVLPSSVRPGAFHIVRIVVGPESEKLVPARVGVVAGVSPGARHPGTTVQLELDPSTPLTVTDGLYFWLAEGETQLLDYRGRPVEPLATAIKIKIDPGSRVHLRDLDLSELEFERDPGVAIGFAVRDGRIAARACVEAGTGAAGDFVAGTGTVLEPGREFDLGDGTRLLATGAGLEFRSLTVPAHAELRLRPGPNGLAIRVVGDVRIDGRLVLDGTSRQLPWRAGDLPALEALLRASGAAIVAGGDFVVGPGSEVVVAAAEDVRAGAPLVVATAGDVRIEGVLPPGCAFALTGHGEFHGVAEGALRLEANLTPGLPTGVSAEAAAWTGWLPLPAHRGAIDVSIVDPRYAIECWLQVAPPHSILVGLPLLEEQFVTPPLRLPLREPLIVPQGAFLRIGLRATVRADAVPSIGGFAVHDR